MFEGSTQCDLENVMVTAHPYIQCLLTPLSKTQDLFHKALLYRQTDNRLAIADQFFTNRQVIINTPPSNHYLTTLRSPSRSRFEEMITCESDFNLICSLNMGDKIMKSCAEHLHTFSLHARFWNLITMPRLKLALPFLSKAPRRFA